LEGLESSLRYDAFRFFSDRFASSIDETSYPGPPVGPKSDGPRLLLSSRRDLRRFFYLNDILETLVSLIELMKNI
jgi:hypothetical protein